MGECMGVGEGESRFRIEWTKRAERKKRGSNGWWARGYIKYSQRALSLT